MSGQAAGPLGPFIRQLNRFRGLDAETRTAIHAWPSTQQSFKKGERISSENREDCRIVVSGVVARHRATEDGKQPIMSFLYPGDAVDVHRYFGRESHALLLAISNVVLASISLKTMRRTAARHVGLEQLLLTGLMVEASVMGEWLINNEKSAEVRIAHLLCELSVRLSATGYGTSVEFRFPFTQSHLGSATGLTPLHVHRTLKQLSIKRMIDYDHRRMTVIDLPALRRLGQFESDYISCFV